MSSWSPDGKQLLGDAQSAGVSVAIYTYSFASGQFTRVSDTGVPWCWLSDGRRVLASDNGKLLVLDTVSKATKELFSVAPDDFDSVALSRDNRTIYFTRETRKGDIWLMTFR